MNGNCPYCDSLITSLQANAINAVDEVGKSWKSATFVCPKCRKVLGVSFDQLAHTEYIINEVVSRLRAS